MDSLLRLPPLLIALIAAFLPSATAQYPPPPTYQNILTSPIDPRITIAYKQPNNGTCATAFTTQKQYTGYVGIPPYTLAPIQQNYSVNTFFWFVEARQTPEVAPLTIWLNGGPGSSSMVGFFNEMGPCQVVQASDGSYTTQYSMWGWDRSSNVLFIDQPNQVGFSYDTATNGSYNLLTSQVYEPPTALPSGLPAFMYRNGTFGTANSNSSTPWAETANTTDIAAQTIWHFLQAWLSAFPQYNPSVRPNTTTALQSSVPAGVNLFTESYGGKYGPVFASYWEQQNQRRANGSIPSNSTLAIKLESVGILNGLVDDLIQDPYYAQFAYNNTYGIQAISQTDELNAIQQFSGSGGCVTQIQACRAAMNNTDPQGHGDVPATNLLCEEAQLTCNNITQSYYGAGYDPYDIRQHLPSPDPPAAYQEYLNNATVLASIGARVNYTESSRYVQAGFIATGDTIRGGQVQDLAYLLSLGVRVALIYGDADFICNWYGGEAISLAVASAVPAPPVSSSSSTATIGAIAPSPTSSTTSSPTAYATAFPAAGYAEIVVNASYIGGAVRQFGNLSFTRIYDAGHFVPYFQPETAFTVFTRIIFGTDIATGDAVDLTAYNTSGPANSTHTNVAPSATPEPTCWLRSFNATCADSDRQALLAGSGVVVAGMFFQQAASAASLLPSASGSAVASGGSSLGGPSSLLNGGGNAPTTTSPPLTGVYTATGTPSVSASSAASPARGRIPLAEGRVSVVAAVAMGVLFGALVVLL